MKPLFKEEAAQGKGGPEGRGDPVPGTRRRGGLLLNNRGWGGLNPIRLSKPSGPALRCVGPRVGCTPVCVVSGLLSPSGGGPPGLSAAGRKGHQGLGKNLNYTFDLFRHQFLRCLKNPGSEKKPEGGEFRFEREGGGVLLCIGGREDLDWD